MFGIQYIKTGIFESTTDAIRGTKYVCVCTDVCVLVLLGFLPEAVIFHCICLQVGAKIYFEAQIEPRLREM